MTTILMPPTGYPDEGPEVWQQRLQAAKSAKEAGEVEPLRVAIEVGEAKGLPKEDVESAAQLLQDLEALRQPLTFAHVPRPEIEELQAATSRDAVVAILSRCLGFGKDEGFQAMILAEFHYHNFAFCQRSGFSAEKTSTLISIFKTVHTKAIVEDKMPQAAARSLLESLLDRHSQQLPPYRLGVFTREEAAAVKAYAERTFFRHYKMYAFAYLSTSELVVQSAFERVAPPVPATIRFQKSHEVDPRTVPELEELFMDPSAGSLRAEEASAAATVPILEQYLHPSVRNRAASPFSDEREMHAANAIDDAMAPHFANLDARDARLATQPLAPPN